MSKGKNRKYAKNPPLSKEELTELYARPLSIHDIEKETGVTYSFIRKLMAEYGIQARSDIEGCRLAFRDPVKRARCGRKHHNHNTEMLGKNLTKIRQSLTPLMQFMREHSSCQVCGEPSDIMHHDPPLVCVLASRITNGLTPLEAVIQIVKEHYIGEIQPIPLCQKHHNLIRKDLPIVDSSQFFP